MPKVLMIGLHPSVVDFDKWPDLDRKTLNEAAQKVAEEVKAAGFEARQSLIRTGDAGVEEARAAMEDFAPDIIVIGAGVRNDPDQLELFERLLNLAREAAPGARFAFNTKPQDTLEALRRQA